MCVWVCAATIHVNVIVYQNRNSSSSFTPSEETYSWKASAVNFTRDSLSPRYSVNQIPNTPHMRKFQVESNLGVFAMLRTNSILPLAFVLVHTGFQRVSVGSIIAWGGTVISHCNCRGFEIWTISMQLEKWNAWSVTNLQSAWYIRSFAQIPLQFCDFYCRPFENFRCSRLVIQK